MANYKKFTKSSMGHILEHFDRTAEHPTENIDQSRTHLNYNLAPKEGKQINILNQRLSEVKVQNRKDVNVLCCWAITMPKSLPENKEEEFFRNSYAFLENKYGKDNVVSAFVHKDEVTPHMHFAFVPVVEDQRKNRLKVSAKECVSLIDLKTFHVELQEHLEKELGCKVEILNEATKEGNKSVEELRRGTAIEKLAEVRQEFSKILNTTKVLEDNLVPLKAEFEAKQKWLEAFTEKLTDEKGIEEVKPLVGKRYFKVTPEKMAELSACENRAVASENALASLDEHFEKLKASITLNKVIELNDACSSLSKQMQAIQAENKKLKKELDRYVQKYGVLVQELPEEEVKVKQRIRSKSKSRETSMQR